MSFRDLVSDIDTVVFNTLSDSGAIEGRTVQGMFSAPWRQPQIGRLNTGLREPVFVVKVADADGVDKGHRSKRRTYLDAKLLSIGVVTVII